MYTPLFHSSIFLALVMRMEKIPFWIGRKVPNPVSLLINIRRNLGSESSLLSSSREIKQIKDYKEYAV